jgi:hypothetical protein
VTVALLGAARQNIERPVSSGNIHSGKISQIKILSSGKLEFEKHDYRLRLNTRSEDEVEDLEPSPCFNAIAIESVEHGEQRENGRI